MISMPNELPIPDPSAAAHSQQLLTLIRNEIAAHGAITFARYMELALYAPGLGYYSAGACKLGAAGDFVTAPEISALFSRSVARQCQQILAALQGGDIFELGAGSGIMATDILLELEKLNSLPKHYYILEVSADLKQRQQILLSARIPHLLDRIKWLDNFPTYKIKGIILANEVLDAMPVHKFKLENEAVREFYITDNQGSLDWYLDQPSHKELPEQISALQVEFAADYESEINLLLPGWIKSLSAILEQGSILIMDYGFGRNEYYHPERCRGTIMCHYRHRAHDNPLLYPGLQDITAHVDFTAIAEAADRANLDVTGYTTQSNFLLNCGIGELAQSAGIDQKTQYQISQQLKKLLLPSEMGELFKVIALSRACEKSLLGFKENDMRWRL